MTTVSSGLRSAAARLAGCDIHPGARPDEQSVLAREFLSEEPEGTKVGVVGPE